MKSQHKTTSNYKNYTNYYDESLKLTLLKTISSKQNIYKQIINIFIYLFSFSIYIYFISILYIKNNTIANHLIHTIPAFCIITSILILIGSNKKFLYYTVYIFCIFFGTIYAVHAILYGAEINAESAIAVITTNNNESIEFIKSFLSYKLLFILCSYIFTQYFFTKKISTVSKHYKINNRDKTISLLIILSIYIPFSALRNFRTPFDTWFPTKVIKQFIVANKELRLASILQAGYTQPANSIYPNSQTIVLIIGESAGRKHMHLYGYPRQTTPDMERINDLHVFTDVISSAPTTHKSIGMMLTLADMKNASYTKTVFDIFKAANFKTFWISSQFSNQSPGSGIVPILAQRADSLWSLKQNLSPDHHYDEYIMPRLLEIIDDPEPKKLIVINLLGSHTSYKERIPDHRNDFRFRDEPPPTATFRNFLGHENVAQIINDYDASIRYTDFVVSKIFESLDEQVRGAWAAIYLSDHGEEVFDTENRFGHAGSSTSRNVYEIPFVLKVSIDYARWMHDAGIFALDTARPYQTDNLIHTMLNLATIETSLYDPKKSIVNPDFRILPRWIKGSPYTRADQTN